MPANDKEKQQRVQQTAARPPEQSLPVATLLAYICKWVASRHSSGWSAAFSSSVCQLFYPVPKLLFCVLSLGVSVSLVMYAPACSMAGKCLHP
mmetsp:Transcript_17510/g.37469  ORF Transcript_17510/g.37469 Transcript_17510/m.37469 type:complete len:93 (-) Transcript_17510:122-400(-)